MTRRAERAHELARLADAVSCPDVAERLDRLAGHYSGRLRRTAREEQAAGRAVRS